MRALYLYFWPGGGFQISRQSHLAVFLGLIIALSGGISRAVTVVQTLDQSHIVNLSGGYSSYNVLDVFRYAQTFRVGIAGTLSQVDLQVSKSSSTISSPLTLSILTLAPNGSPGTVTLGTFTISPSEVPTVPIPFTSQQVVPVDVSSANIPVQVGQSYALMLTSTLTQASGQNYGFITKPADSYATGSGWRRPFGTWDSLGFDFGFQTYVAVPEPGTLSLFILGMLAVRTRFRR